MKRPLLFLALVSVTLLWGKAYAGILDSPAPTFTGGAGKVVFRMGPVYNEPGHVATVVSCTNNNDTASEFALEVFDENDTATGGTSRATVPAGGSVTFTTSAEADVAGALIIANLPPIEHGKARVSATTSKLSCTALQRVRSEDGSTKELPLELVKKVAFSD